MEESNRTHLVVGPNESDNVKLGRILHEFRDKTNLSRIGAARQSDLSSEYLRLIERGLRAPALGTMRAILKSYDIDYQVDGNTVIFETFVVEFISRIKEARHKLPDTPKENRDAKIGQIVRLLVTVDDAQLHNIYDRLLHTGSRSKPSL